MMITMKKGDIIATFNVDYINFRDTFTGARWKQPVRHNFQDIEDCWKGHIRCLKLRGYEEI